ncbi:MAG: hypothetical protein GXP24_09600 [Planctomycetes bacterium]|nr:hypothetical protein [Planctomycetota bacterium]
MSSITLPPLLAAGAFETIISVIVFILWIAAQLIGSRNNEAKGKKQPQPRPQQPQPVDMAEGVPQLNERRMGNEGMGNQGMGNGGMGNRGPGNQGPRNQEEALRSEVEDFLRRAQGKPPKPRPMPQPEQRQKPPRTLQPERSRPVTPVARQSSGSGPSSPPLRSDGVSEHVARHISTQDMATHTEALGAEVATADDQLEARLHEKFDHDLGRLEYRETDTKQQKVDMATEVAAMLRSPEGMRQLIVANEILRRPEW